MLFFRKKKKKNYDFNDFIYDMISTYLPPQYKQHMRTPAKANVYKILCGIIAGDIAGSVYEGRGLRDETKRAQADLLGNKHTFTDDSVMALAIYHASLVCSTNKYAPEEYIDIYKKYMRSFAKDYPDAGYGPNFYNWAICDIDSDKYKSYGDGSAMRVGALGVFSDNPEEVIKQAIFSAWPTHSHTLGVKGAIVTAVLVWMCAHVYTKEEIKKYALTFYGPREGQDIDVTMSTDYLMNVSGSKINTASVDCETAVPEAIINFLESEDYETCMRNCLKYTSDADTVMAISGGMAAAYYTTCRIQGVDIKDITKQFLDAILWDKTFPANF